MPTTGLLFVLLSLLWGGSFVAIDIGLRDLPPVLFAAMRYDVAGLLVLGYAASRTDRWRPRSRWEWTLVAFLGFFMFGAYNALIYIGIDHVSGAVASIVISFGPVLTAGFATTLGIEEPPSRIGALGFLAALVGVVLVADPDPNALLDTNTIGVGIVLLGSVSFAFGTVASRPIDVDLPLSTVQAWAMLVGAAFLHLASPLRGEALSAASVTPSTVAALVYLGVVSGAFAYALYFRLLDRLGPTEINLVGYAEPVVANGLSWLVLGQAIALSTLGGFVAIFTGFFLIKRRALLETVRPADRR
ncbi:Permease of the drug/metabolite transporter (DMT) superfamily [Halapricum desulfuricans]|uniref:Permease of the drug/metabolite transporter (DMT) superfamily n=1 Tax=Halapricum desulfuricans TaxID=2841257 RepID=A0A897NH45_9EURY|nr:EamA family transporter [Halapricum desulfuricans]QSG10775.1 Permease of the drug/metabolite transporter (DMT) superfamily [Halapricum desulfuricans]